MSKGTIHRETGLLRREALGYALELDSGGRWMLDIRGSARKLIGKRVTVEGKRMGFDLIFVDRIWHEGKQWRRSLLKRIELWIVIAVTSLPFVLRWI